MALEAVKIPVFSRAVSITDVIAASVGVVVAVGLSPVFWRCLRLLDRAAGWYLAAMCWSGVMLVGFWGRFDHIVRDRDILYARLQGILVVPFARAHSSSEFEAGENLLLKVCIFAGLTFCLAGWVSRLQIGRASCRERV